jgi:hypothetical protein
MRIKTRSFWEQIITSSNDVVKHFVSNMAVAIRTLGNASRKTAENNDPVKQTAGS